METIGHPALWVGFIAFVLAMLALDLGVFHKTSHKVGVKEAATWSIVWVIISLLFALGMAIFSNGTYAVEYLTGYVIEKSLSVDNIFVFVIIFRAMKIPEVLQHRVLFWGVLGSIVLRAVMIVAGTALIVKFHWLIYIFCGFLIYTGVKIYVGFRKEAQDSLHRFDSNRRLISSQVEHSFGFRSWSIKRLSASWRCASERGTSAGERAISSHKSWTRRIFSAVDKSSVWRCFGSSLMVLPLPSWTDGSPLYSHNAEPNQRSVPARPMPRMGRDGVEPTGSGGC